MNDFYRTGMGQKFFEATMPSLVRQLERLNDNLEAIREQFEQTTGGAIDPPPETKPQPKRQAG